MGTNQGEAVNKLLTDVLGNFTEQIQEAAAKSDIAAQIAEVVGAINADSPAPLTRLRVDGGLTRSRVLMQACADIVGVPIDVYPSPHATALGAAALARLSLDPRRTLDDVVGDWTPSAGYEPHWTASRAAEFRQRWADLAAGA